LRLPVLIKNQVQPHLRISLVAIVLDEFVGNTACIDFVFTCSNSCFDTGYFYSIESTIAVAIIIVLIV